VTPYDFACDGCKVEWEARLPMLAEKKESPCPLCGKPGRRVFNTFIMSESFGHHMFPNRTSLDRRKPRKESEELRVWRAQKDAGRSLHQKG
jgi:putative FmdB family regulatory protein